MTRYPLAAMLAGVLVAVPAVAQDASQEVDVPLQTSPSAEPRGDAGAMAEGPQRADTVLWHAEDLIGKDIRARGDESVGSIEDLVINVPQGAVHVLVDMGGVLGVGEERKAIGLHELTVTQDGDLVLDATAEEVAARPQYRFPESPTTGTIRPGAEVPQTAAGQGYPGQGRQFIPGSDPGPGPASQAAQEREDIPSDQVTDGGLATTLRGGVTGPTSTEADAGYDNRDAYLEAAQRRLTELQQEIEGRALDEQTEQELTRQFEQAAARFETLEAASEEAWPTALKNFRVSLAQLQDNWQQAEGVPGRGQVSGPTADPGQSD